MVEHAGDFPSPPQMPPKVVQERRHDGKDSYRTMEHGDVPFKKADFPIETVDFSMYSTMKNGNLLYSYGPFIVHLAIQNGGFFHIHATKITIYSGLTYLIGDFPYLC